MSVSTEVVHSSGNCSKKTRFCNSEAFAKDSPSVRQMPLKNVPIFMHPGWKIYGETFFQTRTGVWPLWQGEQHWKVPSRVSGFPTLQCLSSGNSRLLLGPLIRDTSATHLVIFSQQHILQMDILESAVDTGDPHHILCALPTGFGKTMPMLLLGHLLPPGAGCKISDPFALHNVLSRVHYDDRGPPHPNWTAAAGRLQEVGLVSPCWQPGV